MLDFQCSGFMLSRYYSCSWQVQWSSIFFCLALSNFKKIFNFQEEITTLNNRIDDLNDSIEFREENIRNLTSDLDEEKLATEKVLNVMLEFVIRTHPFLKFEFRKEKWRENLQKKSKLWNKNLKKKIQNGKMKLIKWRIQCRIVWRKRWRNNLEHSRICLWYDRDKLYCNE